MKKFTALLFAVTFGIMTAWSATVVHTVQRGESLESIAQTYRTTVDAIIQANPGCESTFYVGLKLNIPGAQATSAASTAQTHLNNPTEQHMHIVNQPEAATDEITAEDFSHWFAIYSAQFDHFDKGCYGLGWITYNPSGFGGIFSVNGNWGIVDPGSLMFQFGPVYGYPVHPNILLGAQLKGFILTYENVSGDMKVGGGMLFAPTITFRANRFMLSTGYNLGWGKLRNVEFAHNFQVSIGYNF